MSRAGWAVRAPHTAAVIKAAAINGYLRATDPDPLIAERGAVQLEACAAAYRLLARFAHVGPRDPEWPAEAVARLTSAVEYWRADQSLCTGADQRDAATAELMAGYLSRFLDQFKAEVGN